ncbi:putative oxidoreductase [Camellia lanceoleosa]|uniref:Oxidoreductase n=1 Tax=Camellia lanceoleosa TaxID=1840588 RepID=A0ACC0GWZ8_9ERIC|nr:putative oxidoreductase [Camellia lanceoleosa]
MELTATGTEGNLHVDDFVGPLIGESEAKFYAASDEHTVTTDLPQDALMVTELACLVKGIRGNGLKPEKKWPTMVGRLSWCWMLSRHRLRGFRGC